MERIDVQKALSKTDLVKIRVRLITFEQIFDHVSPDQIQVIETLRKFFESKDYSDPMQFLEIVLDELSKLDVEAYAIDSIIKWITS